MNNEGSINMKSMRDREYVDQEHVMKNEKGNVTVFFLKESKEDAFKDVQELLIDAFENRVCRNI